MRESTTVIARAAVLFMGLGLPSALRQVGIDLPFTVANLLPLAAVAWLCVGDLRRAHELRLEERLMGDFVARLRAEGDLL